MSDHEARAREIASTQRCRNCGTIGDTCTCEAEGGIRISYPLSGEHLVSAISQALREAEEAERERAAKLVDAECERILSKQEGDMHDLVNVHLRMMALLLPDLAASIRGEKDNG